MWIAVSESPRPRPEAIPRAYQTERYDGAHLEAAFTARRYWFRPKAAALLNYLPARATGSFRILEIGRFVGGFLAEGRTLGWDILGLDPGRTVADFCRRPGLPIVQGTVEHAGQSPSSFDAITIWNTFDQLPLLTLPYLYGYSPAGLAGLVGSFGLTLRACHPDTLPSVPVGQLKWWAGLEERVVKGCWRTARAVSRQRAGGDFHLAPWLDVYFERNETPGECLRRS